MTMTLKDTARTRDSVFSYQCHACNKCCHGKGIQVNPYETLRLSSHLKITTTEFRQNYLNGQLLKHKQNSNACIFLGENGCSAHKDRPLVCRLYPLGRLKMGNGSEFFTELTPHPDSAGEYGTASTVNSYLETQNVKSYLHAERVYMQLIQKMANAALQESTSKQKQRVNNETQEELNYTDWILDPYPVMVKYCKLKNKPFPIKIEQQLKLHIKALQDWVDGKWNPVSNE